MTLRPAVPLPQALAVFASLLLATAALSGPAHAAVTVDCSKPGQTIGKKLASATKLLEIIVKGHCVENLEIDRDDVTITAGGQASIAAADPTRPVIMLDGAHRIVIDGVAAGGLTISGGSGGVIATRGATVDLIDCVVQGNSGSGVTSSYGSTVSIDACAIQNNTGNGVVAANAASLAITNSTVTGNSGTGIAATRSSDVRVGQNLSGTAVGAVTVSNHASGVGFSVTENSAGIMVGSTVSNNLGGVSVGRGSGAMIGIGSNNAVSGNTITGNQGNGITVEGGSATIVASTISGSARFGVVLGDSGGGRIGLTPSGAFAANTITANGSAGIAVVQGGSAFIGGNSISGNGTDPADGARNGVFINGGSAMLVGGNTIRNHPTWGVFVNAGGNALIGVPTFTGATSSVNTISGNGTDSALPLDSRGGVLARIGATIALTNAEIRDNTGHGLLAIVNSTLDLTNTAVERNTGEGIWLAGRSYMRMRSPSAVEGNAASGVRLLRGAGAEFFGYAGGPARVTGNALGLNCGDTESSVWSDSDVIIFVSGNTAQNGMGNCTGF